MGLLQKYLGISFSGHNVYLQHDNCSRSTRVISLSYNR